jgi:transposase
MEHPLHRQHDCACPPTRGRGKKSTAEAEALGRRRGGLTTKVHARVDGKGRPFTFALTPGQQHAATMAETLMAQGAIPSGKQGRPRLRPRRLVADKAYGSRQFNRHLRRRGIQPVIPRKRNQKRGRPDNAALYRERNIVERFFCRLKHFRAVATRYDKRATTYLATVLLASIVLCL